ncbi:MAG: hypothetical protein LBP63_11090 [Prevotellaceae bacterium]|jgi:hypothetical protein|nr:hypothetical protein [Prevotellaceae bacterium]
MEKQLQLVTYEQGQRLAKLGFDWKTQYYYRPRNEIPLYSDEQFNFNECNDDIIGSYSCSAPTVALALKWIRDEKNIICETFTQFEKFRLNYKFRYRLNYAEVKSKTRFYDFEAAESALLNTLLNILEKENEK